MIVFFGPTDNGRGTHPFQYAQLRSPSLSMMQIFTNETVTPGVYLEPTVTGLASPWPIRSKRFVGPVF